MSKPKLSAAQKAAKAAEVASHVHQGGSYRIENGKPKRIEPVPAPTTSSED